MDNLWLRIADINVAQYYGDALHYCQYQYIERPHNVNKKAKYLDSHYVYSEPINFTSGVPVNQPFVKVSCFGRNGSKIYDNCHAAVVKNQSVERIASELFEKFVSLDQPSETLNIILLGIDSVSRLNFMRFMPKTKQLLDELSSAVHLNGYTKVADNTFVNVIPLLTGRFIGDFVQDKIVKRYGPFDELPFIWKKFSNIGYRTLYAEDNPNISTFNYAKKGLFHPPTDYYFRAYSLALEEHSRFWNGRRKRLCYGDKFETEHYLEFLKSYIETFNGSHYFAYVFNCKMTHDYHKYLAYVDHVYLHFFQWILENKYMQNTVLVFFSDHGVRFGALRETLIGRIEERLPMVYMIFPHWFPAKYPTLWRNLKTNQQRLTSPFDIHATLENLVTFTGVSSTATTSHKGLSLFSEIPEDRTCSDAYIGPHWCTCSIQQPVDTKHPNVEKAAVEILRTINDKILNSTFHLCAKLKLNSIRNSATVTLHESIVNEDVKITKFLKKPRVSIDYAVLIETDPGGGLFEGTVRHETGDETFTLVGAISRLNLYGNQSKCLDIYDLKQFCFCN